MISCPCSVQETTDIPSSFHSMLQRQDQGPLRVTASFYHVYVRALSVRETKGKGGLRRQGPERFSKTAGPVDTKEPEGG